MKRRDQNYRKNKVLKTAMEGIDRMQGKPQEYCRQEARRLIEEGLEELEELEEFGLCTHNEAVA